MKTNFLRVMLAVFLCACLLTACGPAAGNSYRDDATLDELAEVIGPALKVGAQNMEIASDDWLDYIFCVDRSLFDQGRVYISLDSADISEYGIFHIRSEQSAADVEAMINSYLNNRREGWDDRYLKDQFPKLQKASYFTVGNYVFYAVLSETEKTEVEAAVKSCLTQS